MTENQNEKKPINPSEQPYDPNQDPDADPESLSSHRRPQQPDQAEGDDDPEKTGQSAN